MLVVGLRPELSCERLTRLARDGDLNIPVAGEITDAPSARQLQRTLAGGRDDGCLTNLTELPPAVEYREDFDRVGIDAVHQPIRPLNELADFVPTELWHDAA